jgi:branched-subunit amino acid transport protein AzlD
MLSLQNACILTLVMALVIFFCRLFPFIFFRNLQKTNVSAERLIRFVEKTAPPVAMTVLTFNAAASTINEDINLSLPVIAAAALTALLHIWKRNPLLSIFAGTALYMICRRF